MKRITSCIVTAMGILPLLCAAYVEAAASDIQIPSSNRPQVDACETDSLLSDAMSLSENSGDPSFFDGVIPPSPQAAAIARYAEYPVSHTTGIPDITIPLYEIDLGGYSLPVSISYHASGSRPDQMPTCVGLGWTLNAGGAVSRTVIGKPDMYAASASDTDYRYFEVDEFRKMLEAVKDKHGGTELNHLTAIVTDSPEWDTESDRFTFNVAGKTGVFRYSHTERRYIVLNNSNDVVTSYGRHGQGTSFWIRGTDGVSYDFTREEATGVIDSFNEKPFTSTWYVTLIDTPYGDISFTYEHATPVDVRYRSLTATSGPVRTLEEHIGLGGKTEYTMSERYLLQQNSTDYTVSYGQELLTKIEWNGNRIEFEYVDEHPYRTLRRLTGMKVYSSDGELRKSVTFGNTDCWPTGNSLTGRRLLSSVTDSELGTWRFEYNKDIALPALSESMGSPASCSDLWGYFNTASPSIERNVFTEDQIKWLKGGVGDYWYWSDRDIEINAGSRNRTPNLECTRAGVLEKVTFPTGGSVSYEYELNRVGSQTCGGIRVSAMTEYDGSTASGRKTTFIYDALSLATEDPEKLMNYYFHVQITTGSKSPTPPDLGNPSPYSYRTCTAFPINPVTVNSSPVLYSVVTETRSDGSKIRYEYDGQELTELFGVSSDKYRHPSLFQQSVWDFGNRMPLLKSRTVLDPSGKTVSTEEYEYEKKHRKSFSTGVRTACQYYEYEVPRNMWAPREGIDAVNAAHFGMVQYVASTAFSRVCLLKSRTFTDHTTGFSETTEYTYDAGYRTMLPHTETVTNSDGTAVRKEYTFPFDHDDAVSRDMVEIFQTDFPVNKRIYSGNNLVAESRCEYGYFNDVYFPLARSSWSLPTGSTPQSMPTSLPVREQVGSYNAAGRPLSIKVNGTDETTLRWNEAGTLLESSTAPGGLTTTYTHKPLFGLASVTLPNGHQTKYAYNSAGMLSSVADGSGAIETYTYSIANHPTASMTGAGNSVTTRRFLSTVNAVTSRQYCDGLGRPSVAVRGGANTKGSYLYTAVSYDALGRESQSVLPSVGDNGIVSKTFAQVRALSASTYDNDAYAWSETTYDALDRPVRATTPGEAWHSAGKGKTTQYISNVSNSVRLYRAPMESMSLTSSGYYAAKTLQGVRTVDEDGHEMTVYTDRLGRKVLERRGPESQKGQNDTYFVYNALGQLRFVLSPSYQEDANLTEYGYEYRYDQYGNLVYKAIPGAGYTQYWYDRSGRPAYMQDANLRSNGLYRFFLYDKAGRQAIQGTCKVCTRDEAVNFATYIEGTNGFMSTGYTLANASRIQQATIETVNYYDTYVFAPVLGSHLVKNGTASATGLQTGSVVYASDGSRSVSAIYYDVKGQVVENREITSFGTQRVTSNTYTYTGQPLKTTVTEGSVSVVTENTYDAGSGLLTATDVTVKGVKQRVSAVTYDDLGRISKVTRGTATQNGGTVEYGYNLHGQTTRINGPGFSQNLHYADWNGTKLYNGSVSAMIWSTVPGSIRRGYRYSYNGYGWLTSAEYGEGEALTGNRDRYTEKSTTFTRNGGVKALQRNGLRADGTYGRVDDLTVSYTGNRVTGVSDAAPAVTQNGSMDYPGGNTSKVLTYNGFGALVSDGGRGITSVSYDSFGNPVRILCSGNRSVTNVYSATGEKLKTVHAFNVAAQAAMSLVPDVECASVLADGTDVVGGADSSTSEYHGSLVYRDGRLDMVLFPGGYATVSGATVTFHYYTRDYLGNNRAVINGSTGALEQTVAYYPYGGVIPDMSANPTTVQPYKFGGKELITANGFNEYDFGARQYYSAVPGFTKPDPMCEKYYWLSPYLYCGNNPVNLVDPSGMIWNDPEEAEQLKNDINKKISSYQNQVIELNENISSGEGGSKLEAQISDLNQRIGLLQKGLSDIDLLGNDSQYTYTLSHVDGSGAHTVRLGDDGMVYIETSENALSVHEIAHVRQSKDVSGDGTLDFSPSGALRNPGTREKKHLARYQKTSDAEIEAYQMQFAFNPSSLPKRANNVNAIDVHYVGSIMNGKGQPAYPPIHEYSKYIKKMHKLNLPFP